MNPNNIEMIDELSPMQHAMLFHSLMAPRDGVYVLQMSLRLTGRLDLPAFERAWCSLVARHAILRTAFFWEDLETPRQVVFRDVALGIARTSWRGLGAAEQEARLAGFLAADRARGFELTEAPLLRLALFELAEDVHQLVWTVHHLLVDGWSRGQLLRELFATYTVFSDPRAGLREPRLEPPHAFHEYIAWLQRQDPAATEGFWRRALAGLSAPSLVAEDAAPEGSAGPGGPQRRVLALSQEESSALRGTARRQRLTLNTLVQGAWGLLLSHLTGREDVVFGVTVSGRPAGLPGVESILGPFINTLPARIAVRPERGLRGWLAEIQERQAEMSRYEHSPLVDVQRWSGLPAGVPLFDHIVVFESIADQVPSLPGLTIVEESASTSTNYPLNMVVLPGGPDAPLTLSALYDAGRFAAPDVARILERLAGWLRSFAAAENADLQLGELPVLLPGERQQVLVEWNDTATGFPREASLPELFAAVAREQPEALALLGAGGEIWSYRRLDAASDRLARRLRALGTAAEAAVGIAVERSPELIVGILAILKAGGVYVPLDPAYPDERLDFILADTGAGLVLVHEKTRARLAGRAELVEVEEEDITDPRDTRDEHDRVPAESLAYVVYTSGSTGRPKGVAVTHRAVVRLVRDTNYVALRPGDRTSHASNISFDAATYEIWGALLTGAALVVIPREVVLSPADFAARLRETGVTSMFLTSALFARMAHEVPDAFAAMSELMVGGEAVDPGAARTVLAGRPPQRLLNVYGPTESTTFATWHPVREVPGGAVSIPVGRAVANTTLYVLDRSCAVVPRGGAGELAIGGDGLARGYLNRPGLTAERFVPHPWPPAGQAGERLYRTGDLARHRADGALEVLGRIDSQVKVRGFRIELGEIEAALAAHPAVRACVAGVHEAAGDRHLVAWVVPEAESVEPSALAAHLRERLPNYMVPSFYVPLDALPLTPNGKVDRKALPAPKRAGEVAAVYGAPSGPVEELLAGIYAEVLAVERVGVHDSFFELGGHSLLATQVVSRIRAVLGVDLPLRELFASPTVAEVAQAVGQSRGSARVPQAPQIVPVPRPRDSRGSDLPLSFAQQRLWFLDRLEPGSAAYNIPLAVRLQGDVEPGLLARIFGEVVRRHEALRTTFAHRDGRPVQVIGSSETALPPVVDLSGLSDRSDLQARQIAREEALRPFDLRRGPLLRFTLVRLGGRDWLLLLTLHHIVSDGWSMGVLLREIGVLYEAFSQERPSPLPELPVQYADYAVWQRGWLQGDVLREEIEFWRRQLAGAPRMLELPTDRPRQAKQTFRGATRPMILSPPLSPALAALCRGEAVTPFMALLACWALLLGRHAGQDDVVVGLPVAGRNRREIEDLIGFFVNTLVLRLDLGGAGASFADLLQRTRERALDAYTHQDLPFERLVEELVHERDLAISPLFQVLFALQNLPSAPVRFPGLELTPVVAESEVAKFDLSLYLAEGAEGIGGSLEFNTDLFDGTTAERFTERFACLVAAAVAGPACPLGELPLLGPAQRDQLLAGWNATAEAFPEELCVHELIAAQVARTPEAPAVSSAGERWSYRELWEEAGRLAARLVAMGVGPEVRVAVRMGRSPRMLATLLGVLRAGGAYVPLDPAHPQERLAHILEDARVRVVVSDEGVQETGEAEPPPPAPWPVARPENLAYVIYTSGSTGRPKGVGVCHRGVVNYVATMARRPGMSAADVVVAVITLSFDMAVTELLLPLTVGARIELVGRETAGDAVRLAAVLESAGATFLQATPATWTMLVEGRWRGRPGLKALCGGEALPRALAEKLLPLVGELWNVYGPTETTVLSAAHCVSTGFGAVPIGLPLGNTTIHLWGRWGELVPPGAAGELLIGGAGLARGYHGRPDLTAERFVPDPFGDRSGARLYRTGDLARRRPDGTLEVLGRIDFQVKIRGFRIEPGEIEAVLAGHPQVRQCVVLARRDLLGSGGETRLVGYVVPRGEGEVSFASLREHLRARLPEHMVPAAFVVLPAFPLNASGKLDRKALPVPVPATPVPAGRQSELEEVVAGIWCEVLGVPRVGFEDNFFDLGGHSLLLPRVQARLSDRLGREVSLVDLLTHTTVRALARHLEPCTAVAESALRTAGTRPSGGGVGSIAIVGLSGRFPGAPGVERLWDNLCAGVFSIARFSEEELDASGVDPVLRRDPRYVPAAGILDGVELFDAGLFGFSPREAEILDPQHRLFLECAWEALEDAGYDSRRTPGPVGVFAGVGFNRYLHQLLAGLDPAAVGGLPLLLGNDKDFLATRVSYKLDLEGPSMTVQTACSSSLVAVHLACQNLLLGACDMALAGGVSISLPQRAGYLYEEGGIASPDGFCRAFDAEARGSVSGSGAGIVVLKRLEDALAHGDTIRAVLLGSAVNNDGGSGKAGYTAPSVSGQAAVISAALAAAGVDPATISYVETHGTGTPLGDPVEVQALARAFRRGGVRERSCALGSVKSNLGHLDAAAGVTGLIKTTLALQHGLLPPSLGFSRPNPQIDFTAGPFHVQTELAGWERGATPRRAGVSAFGIGGTNAHAVLEEAPPAEPSGPSRPWQVLLLSARTPTALEEATDRLAVRLEGDPGLSLADAAYTLRAGRRPFAHRRAVVVASREEAVAALRSRDPKRVWTASREAERHSVAFLLPGVGDQSPGLARGLYRDEPVFRREIDLCAELLLPHLGLDLRDALFATEEAAEETASAGPDLRALLGRGGRREEREPAARTLLQETRVAQPVLFAASYALARLWMSWGVQPAALLGYSLGEYTAACLAGVMELPDALALVARRARLIGELAPGALLAVPLPEEETRARLGRELALAAVNAPEVSVVAGPPAAVAALERQLAQEGLPCRRLQAAQAFHSWMMQPVAEALRELLRSIPLAPPRIPYLSNVTGRWIEPAQATDPGYWVSHLVSTVRFAAGVTELWREPGRILIEMGPGPSLGSLALQQIPAEGAADRIVLSSLPHELDRQPDQRFLLQSLGRLWLAGAQVDWSGFQGDERRRRVPLPAYPFERQRFWIEPGIEAGKRAAASHRAAPGRPERSADIAGWFHVPSWKRAPRLRSREPGVPGGRWLVLLDPLGLGDRLAKRLAEAGCEVATAQMGEAIDFDALLEGLGEVPDRVLHLWSLGAEPVEPGEAQARGYHALIALAQALVRREAHGPVEIAVIANGLCDVERGDSLHLEKATLLGPLRVIPREHPEIACRLIDVDAGEIGTGLGERLLAELGERTPVPVVSLRGPHRWLPVYEPVPLAPVAGRPALGRAGGTYLMIGGAGFDLAGPLQEAGAEVSVLAAEEVNEPALGRAVSQARRGAPPGFLVLFSALDALAGGLGGIGGIGRTASAAAGAFLGAFTRDRSFRDGMPVVTIHWCRGLTAEERMEALDRILESGLSEVVVSDRDLEEAIHSALAAAGVPAGPAGPAGSPPGRRGHARPALATPWAAPSTATEEAMALLWGELLGIEPIGIHDNFFELGGHSLLGLQLVSRLPARLGVELPLQTLFEAPTVAALAGEVEERRRRGETAGVPPIGPVPREGCLPLSFAQQRLWLLDRLEPGSASYNIPLAVRLRGAIEPGFLVRIFAEVVRRHEVLRTTFDVRSGEPVQVIAAPYIPALPVVDLADLPEARREDGAREIAGEEARRPFDLRTGPLLRLVLLRLGVEERVLLITQHHIISDGWSTGVLLREIGALGEAFARGGASPLPELPVQYGDFAVWQRGWLQGAVLKEQLGYWKRQLAGAPWLLELPTDRPRPPMQTFRGATRPVVLAPAPELAALCRRAGATPFMALLAAWALLLGRHAGQDDVVVGSPVAGRNRREIEDLIGFFVNTLVLRIELGSTFGDLLGRVREVALGAFAHQDLPFERLVEELVHQRDLAVSPLFQALFSLQNVPSGPVRLPGLELAPVEVESAVAKFDLSLYLAEGAEGIAGFLEFNTDLFDGATAERLVERFVRLVAGAVADPACPLGELALLLPAEREQLLTGWNATAEPFPEALCVHDLIAAQVARTPAAPAVSGEGERWSYRELWEEAGRFATRLAALGVGPEVLVAVRMERSPRMLAALLGVLRAGGAYVPLDPSHPQERLAFILEDSRVRVVITDEGVREVAVAEGTLAPAGPENLAYVIYTSGSTGRPKGVGVRHGGVVNYLATMARRPRRPPRPGMSTADVVVALTTLSFDIAVTELLLPLTVGARIELVDRETAGDAALLAAALEDCGATFLQATPATWTMLVEGGWSGRPGLKALCGGEALPRALAEKLLPRVSELWNVYGPTETTVWSSAQRVATGSGAVPVGLPLGNTTIHLAGRWDELVPPGAAGELLIGGAGLARGYHGRPDLTAERFVPDPFGDRSGPAPGARLYRTGDLARRRQDGALEVLGRIDFQVKVRGFRIELGEIEAVLAAHPAVRACVAGVREAAGDRRLVAWVIPAMEGAAASVEPSALAAHLRECLPDYMVPSAFVLLDAFPLTPSGKVDRKALPAPEGAGAAYEPPADPLEESLAALWAEVLRVERVGRQDHFFALGGHSLLATRVVSRLRETMAVEVPLRRLFEAPVLAAFAGVVRESRAGVDARTAAQADEAELTVLLDELDRLSDGEVLRADPRRILARLAPPAPRAVEIAAPQAPVPLPRPQEAGENAAFPLSFAQQRLWFLDRLQPGNPVYNVPMPVRVRGVLPPALLDRIFAEVSARHEALRTTFAEGEDGPVQVIHPERLGGLRLLDLSGLPAAEREERARQVAQEEAFLPFDLQAGPLLRLTVVRLADADHLLLVTLHHIVSDGWSLGVLLRELAALWTAFSQGRPSPLPALPIQYADFSVWQRQWLQGRVLEEQLAWWKNRLTGAPAVLEMPTDRPRPVLQTYRGAARETLLAPAVSAAVRELCRSCDVTPFMALLALWAVLLARHGGQDDVPVGTPVAGRHRRETVDLIGFFVNTLVVRVELGGAPDVRSVLERVRQAALGAFIHQDLPFERIVEELVAERDPSHAPLFQVMFSLQQNAGQPGVAMPAMILAPVAVESRMAKFDLTLTTTDGADGFATALEYNTDLFDRTTAGRLLARFEALLAAATADPGRSIQDLPLLPAAERHQTLLEWNDGTAVAPSPASWGELFEAAARRVPEAPAVVGADGEVWSYRRLDEASNRLARRLRALGIGLDEAVGICVERSPELIVGLVAVLKAGGVYLPLNPGHPDERLSFQVEDTGARVVLVHARTRTRTEGGLEGCTRLEIVPAALSAGDEEAAPLGVRVPPECLSYIIYTSGSTGVPKGVGVPHRAAVDHAVSILEEDALGPGDRVIQFASLSFDVSIEQIFPTLIAGSALVLRGEELASPEAMFPEFRRLGITIANLPTAYWQQAVRELSATTDPSLPPLRLRMQTVGGEAMLPEAARRWVALTEPLGLGGVRLVNGYGPTETVVTATRFDVSRRGAVGTASVLIGRLLPLRTAYVVDGRGHLQPPGVPGELLLGGILARGYVNRPELTAERFVPDPFGDRSGTAPGGRLYRTGDLVRLLPEGELDYLGRIDRQVKIRGFRIEPGEVETALAALPGVRDCAVVARRDTPAGDRLVAYVVAGTAGAGLSAATLREALKKTLPDYMLPAATVFLDVLPLTANGKVDRKALPAPGRTAVQGEEPVAARDALELRLVQIWEDLLDVRPVGLRDSFFALGGHSLLAVRLVGTIERQLGCKVPLAALMAAPTVERMAHLVREAVHLERSPVVPIEASGTRPPLFLVHPVGGNVFCYLPLVRGGGVEGPVYGLQAPDPDALPAPWTIESMAERYVAALREVQPSGPYRLAGWSLGGVVAWEMAGRLTEEGSEVALLAMIDPGTPQAALEVPDPRRELAQFFADLGGQAGIDPSAHRELPAEAMLDDVLAREEIRALLPPDVAERQIRELFALFRANVRALSAWTPRPYAGRLTLIRAAASAAAQPEAAEAWRGLASEGAEVHVLPGDHYSLLRAPRVAALAALLAACLHRLDGAPESPAERRAALSPARRELLAALLRERQAAEAAIHPRGTTEPAPLSLAQERMWFLHLLDPQSPAYNVHLGVSLEGVLKPAALAAALAGLRRRHQVLATRYEQAGARPVQVIEIDRPSPLPTLDLSGLPAETRGTLFSRLQSEEGGRPFDLLRGPVLHAVLIRLAPEEHALLLTIHHVATDGWSWGILLQDLATLYAAHAAGTPVQLPAPRLQYADFAAWQRRRLQGEALEEQLAYWRRQLEPPLPLLQLPTDRPRETRQTYHGGTVDLTLPAALTADLRALANARGATLFMVLLAGLTAVLQRSGGDRRILVGAPVAGRTRAEIEGLVGFFLNTLVLPVDLDGDPSFAALLDGAARSALGAFAHQELPFETLLQRLRLERGARGPFQVMLLLQNLQPHASLQVPGLTMRPLSTGWQVDLGTNILEISLTVEERGPSLYGKLDYNALLFEAATIGRLAGQMRTLLRGAVADPSIPLSELPLLTAAEERELLAALPLGDGRYVTDPALRPMPPGVLGELLLGGPGVPQDAFDRPERAAEGFVPDPFSGAAGARLLRTGERVRRRPGGELEGAGLLDHHAPAEVLLPVAEMPEVAPRNETEEAIAEIWCELLGLERVSVFDSFFELGGHSLLLRQVLQRLHDAFDVEIPLRSIYEERTVAALALKVEELAIQALLEE